MELNIGKNIKRLRLVKGLTQEQLAELLCVSTAAVSKWEAKNSYPDITMLFPLASIFGVGIDELLGYNEAKAESEIEDLLSEYRKLHIHGSFSEATELIIGARKRYPHDYRIMHTYMWDKAGGNAGNSAEILTENSEEFLRICNCILDGCNDENIRLEALNMQAKLRHARGETDEALEILSQLPSWVNSAQQKKEQLFSKNIEEYRYWNRRNCYAMMDGMAIKLARTVRFDDSLSANERINRLERMGDELTTLGKKPSLECFCIAAQAVYSILAGSLTVNDSIADIIRIREKQFDAMEDMLRLARTDESLKNSIRDTYKTDDIIAWAVNRMMNSPHPQFASLRNNGEYIQMLEKWKNKHSQ